jgi:hypothetical protein
MWNNPETAPHDTRILVSANGKVWIGRLRFGWLSTEQRLSDKSEWSFEGKTKQQIKAWPINGWQHLPEAVNAKRRKSLTYLDCLVLPTRTHNVLEKHGFTTRESLMGLTFIDLVKLPGISPETAEKVLIWRNKPELRRLERLDG